MKYIKCECFNLSLSFCKATKGFIQRHSDVLLHFATKVVSLEINMGSPFVLSFPCHYDANSNPISTKMND